MKLVESQPGFALSQTTSGNYTDLNIRLDMAPGDKADFVAGMKYLINRQQIQKSVAARSCRNRQRPAGLAGQRLSQCRPEAEGAMTRDKAKFHFQKAGRSRPVHSDDHVAKQRPRPWTWR